MVRSSYPILVKHLSHILDSNIRKYISVIMKLKEAHNKKNNGLS
jgi:hypothetical protein